MATFTDATAFANHIAGYGKRIEGADRMALKAELDAVTIIVKKHGSRYKLRGRTGGKWPLGAKASGPYAYGGTQLGYVDADPKGFWTIVQKGAGPHWIGPRKIGARARRNAIRRGSPIGEKGGIFASGYEHPIFGVLHPGTHGAIGDPWGKAMAEASVVGPKVYEHALVSSVFGVAA
jgi:hypothetical protein